MAVQLRPLSRGALLTLHPSFVAIYRDAFSPPPYRKPEAEILEFSNSFPLHQEREAFRCVGAFETDSERLVGFAYGYAATAGRWWYAHVKPALPEPLASAWLDHSFQLVEIAVDPRDQGQGIGGLLHDNLLRDLPFDRAVLSTLQVSSAVHRLYQARGWIVLRDNLFFPGVPRRYQIMGLELKPGRAAA